MSYIEKKYANMMSMYLDKFVVKSNSPYIANFRCPYCGDSKLNQSKARGYLYEESGKIRFKCHNCSHPSSFSKLLKHLSQPLYNEFRLEAFGTPKTDLKFKKRLGEVKKEKLDQKKTDIEKLFEPLSADAKTYVESRKIPEKSEIYFAKDFSVFKEFFKDKNIPSDSRIIFPIRDRSGKIIGINGRAIYPTKMRYVLLRLEEAPLIYNLDKIDISKKVYVVEGAIDSLFLPNSLAVNGSDLGKVFEYIPKENCVLIYDNQPKNLEIVKKMVKSCNNDYNVVVWPPVSVGKDINDMVKNQGKEKVLEIIDSHTYKGLKCRAKIAEWRKI